MLADFFHLHGNFVNSAEIFDNAGFDIHVLGNTVTWGLFMPVSVMVIFDCTVTQSLTGTAIIFSILPIWERTLTLGGALTVNNNLTNSAGILNNATFDITVSGDGPAAAKYSTYL